MCAPHFASLLQASKFELVADTPKGHTSKFAPSNLRRKRDGSPSRHSKTSSQQHHQARLSRWDASSTSHNSPTKPQKPSVDTPPSLKRICRASLPCSLHNVLKPVRRNSMDTSGVSRDICTPKSLNTAAILSNVLENFSLLTDDTSDANIIFGNESDSGIVSCCF